MKNKRQSPNVFCVVGGAALALAIPAGASAYNLVEKDGTQLNLDIEAMYGVFSSQENYSTIALTEPGGSTWTEGYIKYGFSGSQNVGKQSALYAGVNLVSSGTWGDGDAVGFTSGNERKTNLEDAYLGWRSGNLIPALGENGLDVSFGRQQYEIGSGFLVKGDALNFGDALNQITGVDFDRGGAYWLAPRKAFDQTAIVRIGGSEGLRTELFWLQSDNKSQASMELAGLNAEYAVPEGTFGVTYLEGLDVDEDSAAVLGYGGRDGQKTYSLRYEGNAGVENLFLATEFVHQKPGGVSDDSVNAWYVEGGWTFSDTAWSPSVNYRFSTFDEGFDPLFYGFSRGYGTWFQGEVAASYAGPFNSGTDVHLVSLRATPTEMLSVGALLFNFNDTLDGTGGVDANELDLYAEWAVTPNIVISPLVGFYKPDNSAAQGGTQIGNDDMNVYGQVLAMFLF